MQTIVVPPSEAYELLDSGNGERLERFGIHTVVRPDPQVLWKPSQPNNPAWHSPDARFSEHAETHWQFRKPQLAEGWDVRFSKMTLRIKPTPFRHLGVFPEQAANWSWVADRLEGTSRAKVLNLFGYTGALSIAAAQAGALVTHVDSAKGTVHWASENAKRSGLAEQGVRWIVDDAYKFVRREARRNASYDLIALDPPVFGRGAKGEVWRLEDDLGNLLQGVRSILSPTPKGLLINIYATALYPQTITRLVEQVFEGSGLLFTVSELILQESDSGTPLPTGYVIRGE